MSYATEENESAFPALGATKDEDDLVEQDVKDRFKKMCEGYFENVTKKLVIEHKVRARSLVLWLRGPKQILHKRLQDQDRRNHEAYIRSGEIFEDRQQAYEKMTKGYEKLLASCNAFVYFIFTFYLRQ